MVKLNNYVRVEWLPFSSGCAKMCPHCSLKKTCLKEEISEDAQKTFALIEEMTSKKNMYCDFAIAGNEEIPLPNFKKPEIINEVMVQCDIPYEKQAVKSFSKKIKNMLSEKKLQPKQLGVALFPSHHIITNKEVGMAKMLIDEISTWYFTINNFKKYLRVSFNTNQVPRDVFERDSGQIKIAQNKLKILLESYSNGDNSIITVNEDWQKDDSCKVISTDYILKNYDNVIYFDQRVISTVFEKPVFEFNKKNGLTRLSKSCNPMFMITKKGVMLIHSTKNINNPIFWVNHQDFKESLIKLDEYDFEIFEMINFLIETNWNFYNEAFQDSLKSTKEEGILNFFQTKRKELSLFH